MANPVYMTVRIQTEFGAETPKAPVTQYHTDRMLAERQYSLNRASGAISEVAVDTTILMSIDGTVIEKNTYTHQQPAPEPEPEEQ